MEGYAKIARLFANNEDLACVRRFKDLNFLDLLFRQAEIVFLEDEYRKAVGADRASKAPLNSFYAKDWVSMSQGLNRAESIQWRKWLQIRSKLKEYSTGCNPF